MFEVASLWIPATIAAAAAQTARNAMQRHLTGALGTIGATYVRFVYGAPFALVFLALVLLATGEPMPAPILGFLAFLAVGALAQVLATALMLAAMGMANFSATITYTKTEPVQVAVFGLVILGEPVSRLSALAILIATAGIVVMSKPQGGGKGLASLTPAALGLASGALFAISAICYRGAILSLEEGSFIVRASTALAWALCLQAGAVSLHMLATDRPLLAATARAWRQSLFAGFMGALASFFWFTAFSLAVTAHVRALALVEVLFASLVSGRIFAQRLERQEIIGMGLVLAGVLMLLLATAG
jgi:drug/metabolite transporter (DMT)-like permease